MKAKHRTKRIQRYRKMLGIIVLMLTITLIGVVVSATVLYKRKNACKTPDTTLVEYMMHIPKQEYEEMYAMIDLESSGYISKETSVYKGYKQDKIEMRGDRAEMSDFPLYLNTVAGGLDRRDQTIGGFSFVVKIYAVPVVEIIGQLLYLLGRYGFNAQFSDCL